MAMSVVLVMCAVLFTRNLTAIESSDPGFDRRNLIMFDIRPVGQLDRFYFNLEQQLAATPGVSNVGIASIRPMNVAGRWEDLQMAGQNEIRNANVNSVTPNYLSLYAPRLVAGRGFEWTEVSSSAKVAVVSEDLAKKLGGPSILGKRLTFDEGPAVANPPAYEIVGIAPAMAATSMKERPFVVWLPLDRESSAVTVVLRTSQPPSMVLPSVRKTMANIDRKLPLVDVVTMEEQISKGLQRERMFAIVCSCFGVLALVLSVVGLYGVMAYNTARRSGEIGIRLALGARPREVVSMIIREGMTIAVLGLLLGLPAVWFGAKYVEKLLFQMKPLDPATLVVSLSVLLLAALAAVTIPAIRASGIQPSQTLRQD
jgi:predicted permease